MDWQDQHDNGGQYEYSKDLPLDKGLSVYLGSLVDIIGFIILYDCMLTTKYYIYIQNILNVNKIKNFIHLPIQKNKLWIENAWIKTRINDWNFSFYSHKKVHIILTIYKMKSINQDNLLDSRTLSFPFLLDKVRNKVIRKDLYVSELYVILLIVWWTKIKIICAKFLKYISVSCPDCRQDYAIIK